MKHVIRDTHLKVRILRIASRRIQRPSATTLPYPLPQPLSTLTTPDPPYDFHSIIPTSIHPLAPIIPPWLSVYLSGNCKFLICNDFYQSYYDIVALRFKLAESILRVGALPCEAPEQKLERYYLN